MQFSFSGSETLEKTLAAIKRLRSVSVSAGLLPGAPSRSRRLLTIHEHGSPIMHIPPRPVIGPALAQDATKEAISSALLSSCEAAFQGDENGVLNGFDEAGKAAVQGIRSYIDSGISPSNSPVTVSGGWIYNPVAKTGVPVGGKGFDRPMVETGQLYDSFDYEVKT